MKSVYDQYVSQLCDRYINKDSKVFDCGCGDGQKTAILARYSENVTGGDLEDRTNSQYNVNFTKISETDYGKANTYDVVTAFDVIEHIKNDLSFVKELLRITKNGGNVIIGTPNRNRLSNKLISLFKGQIKYPRTLGFHYESGGEICHIREYTKSDFLNLISKINNAKVAELNSYFFGLYTPFGPVGTKKQNVRICKYAQHLFLILKKYN